MLALVASLTVTGLLAGCGSSSSTDSSGPESVGEPSAAFLKPGSSTNQLVEFGHEGSANEREAAGAILAKSFAAREEADFPTQCSTLSQRLLEEIAKPKKGAAASKACPAALKKLASPLTSTEEFRIDTFKNSEVAALRVKGNTANALYHGNDKKDYAATLAKEGTQWKVATLSTTELNPPEPEEATKPPKG